MNEYPECKTWIIILHPDPPPSNIVIAKEFLDISEIEALKIVFLQSFL